MLYHAADPLNIECWAARDFGTISVHSLIGALHFFFLRNYEATAFIGTPFFLRQLNEHFLHRCCFACDSFVAELMKCQTKVKSYCLLFFLLLLFYSRRRTFVPYFTRFYFHFYFVLFFVKSCENAKSGALELFTYTLSQCVFSIFAIKTNKYSQLTEFILGRMLLHLQQ